MMRRRKPRRRILSKRDEARIRDVMNNLDQIEQQAAVNVAKWGKQPLETLGLVAAEEMRGFL